MHKISNHQAQRQSNRRNHFKIKDGLATHASDLLHVLHAGNAGHHSAENNHGNDHRDQTYKGIAQRLHRDGGVGAEVPEDHCQRDGEYDLDPQRGVERLFA